MLSTVRKIGPTLDLFTVQRPEWGISEVAQALEIPKSSAHALLTSLADVGLLERTPVARYRLGWRLLVLGRTLVLGTEYREPVCRALRHAATRWGETMHFAVYERGHAIYVEKVESRQSVKTPTRTGVRLPCHASGVGKVLLAHRPQAELAQLAAALELPRYTPNTIVSWPELRRELEQVRRRGVAFDMEESLRDVCCAAAPVRDRHGVVVGAVSLTAARSRFERHREAYVDAVRGIGERVSTELAGRQRPGSERPQLGRPVRASRSAVSVG